MDFRLPELGLLYLNWAEIGLQSGLAGLKMNVGSPFCLLLTKYRHRPVKHRGALT